MKLGRMVTVNVSLSHALKPYVLKYQILVDEPKEKVLEVYRKNEPLNVFTLPIYTGVVDDLPDFSDVIPSDFVETEEEFHARWECIALKEGLDHGIQPYYIGNFKPIDIAIKELERAFFTNQYGPTERIYEL